MGSQENGVGGSMKVGDLVEGFSTNVVGLKGILTKVERREGTASTFGRTIYYILWSDGTVGTIIADYGSAVLVYWCVDGDDDGDYEEMIEKMFIENLKK